MTEAELAYSHVLNCDRLSLYLNKDTRLNSNKAARVSRILKRRIIGEPLQYILGTTEFMGLEFKVDKRALIPRPETEILVETVLKLINLLTRKPAHPLNILDLGTGSGCIAVSLAKFLPQAKIFASDVSKKALAIAKDNALRHNVDIEFILSDLFDFVGTQQCSVSTFDLIISNPPYIKTNQINKLQVELSYEPLISLDGGRDGLDFYRRIIQEAGSCLKTNGYLILEIGFNQKAAIENIFQKNKKFEIMRVVQDYNNIERVLVARRLVYG